MSTLSVSDTKDQRIQRFLKKHRQRQYAAIDRMFGVLMLLQWLAGIAAAYWVSPLTWEGAQSSTHPHVWLALGLGSAIASLPLILTLFCAGRTVTRHVNAIAQVSFSILLIHLTGGRIETHFHVFGSLAFLACYRDWKVLIPATLVVAVDHFIRGIWWPESVFGSASASYWRWLEHAGWVIFEDVFLIYACWQGVAQMRSIAARAVELEDTDRWKQTILSAALDAVVTIDCDGRIIEWNRQAEMVFGWSAHEVIGQLLHDTIIPVPYRKQHQEGLRTYLVSGNGPVLNRRIEITALRRDGTEFPVELAITPIHVNGQLTFCGFIRDITERKRAEQELRRTKEAAEAANEAKSRFLANMSHEIRTPLNGILGFTELLRRGADRGDDSKRREFIDTIDCSGRHLLTVINDVLDLSKIEAGQLSVNRVTCSPHETIAEIVSILRVTAQKKGLTLDYHWNGNVPETVGTDPDRLRQILMNLVGNAVKFTEHGAVTIGASVQRESETSPWLLKFTISDTGIGIAADQLALIFEPFVQGDSSVTRRYGGTGLGLSICKRLCKLLGGGIEVQSRPGSGSVFTFTVDAGVPQFGRVPRIGTGDLIASAIPASSPTAQDLRGRKILLVEDGETNRRLIEIVLHDAGATVVSAENGEQGLRESLRQPFDAILLDMQMPVMDGYLAAAAMRKANVQCPIIALTAHSMSGDAEKCLSAGCSYFLSKPVEEQRLLKTLISALSSQPNESSSVGENQDTPVHEVEPLFSTLPMDREVYRQIVIDYVESLPEKLASIEEACRNEDVESLQRLTHTLKGSGGTAGYPELTTAADKVSRALTNRSARWTEDIRYLRSVIERVVAGSPAKQLAEEDRRA